MNRRFKENTMLAQLGWRAAMWGLVLTITMAILAIACGGGNSSSPTAPSGLATAPTPTPIASSIVASLDGQSLVGAAVQATAAAHQLLPGSRLLPGQSLASTSGRYRLLYQLDGDLVLSDDVEGVQLWATNTAGTSAGQTIMQPDGNFVVYDAQGTPHWFTETGGNANARLVLQPDGNLVVYSADGQAVWDRLSASTPEPDPEPDPTPTPTPTPTLPATQVMTAMPVDPAAVRFMAPSQPSHVAFDFGTTMGGRFFSIGTGVVTLIELNTGLGLPGSNYRIVIQYATDIEAGYHFENDGFVSEQAQRDNILVAAGDRVTPGQHIGNLLSQGTNAHVDFSILEAFEPVMCPLGYFSPEVATTLENLWDSSAVEKRPSLPDLCN